MCAELLFPEWLFVMSSFTLGMSWTECDVGSPRERHTGWGVAMTQLRRQVEKVHLRGRKNENLATT